MTSLATKVCLARVGGTVTVGARLVVPIVPLPMRGRAANNHLPDLQLQYAVQRIGFYPNLTGADLAMEVTKKGVQ